MSRISEIFRKVSKTLNSSPNKTYPKITANEVELNSFKERERLDNIKQELIKYRSKNAMLNDKGDINIHKKQPSLLVGNTLIKDTQTRKENLLDAKNAFW